MRFAVALLLLGVACTATDQYRGRQAPDAPVITVLVPGYRGSFLYEDNGRLVYLEPGSAFRTGHESLGYSGTQTRSGRASPLMRSRRTPCSWRTT